MRRLIYSTAACLFSILTYAQDETIRPNNVTIASPTAASLGKVVDIPVGFNTGTPNVDLPIYTVEAGPLKVPIGLSYHASGLKVNEQASWVGAGWSLSAGGMITRTVRGLADEIVTTNSGSSISYLSSRGFYDYAYSSMFTQPSPYNVIPEGLALAHFTDGISDGEADLFTFNFNGYSGKFYFRADTSIAIVPGQDLRIRPRFCNGSNCNSTTEYLYGWVITTPDGVEYHFGKSLNPTTPYTSYDHVAPLEYTQTFSYTQGATYTKTPSSWFLNKIVSPDKQFAIDFTYAKESYSYYTMSLFPKSSGGGADYGMDLVKNIMSGVRLSKITFPNNGQVVFAPTNFARQDLSDPSNNLDDIDQVWTSTNNTSACALAEIQISSGASTPCRTFKFTYDYFFDNTSPLLGYLQLPGGYFNIHSDKRRLMLKSLAEEQCTSGDKKPPHLFEYYDPQLVPRTLSFAQDHWGYFNGAVTNASMLPAVSSDGGLTVLNVAIANRDAAWPAARRDTEANRVPNRRNRDL